MIYPIISVKNVAFKYLGGKEKVLQDITFDINKGSFVAIIGGMAQVSQRYVNH